MNMNISSAFGQKELKTSMVESSIKTTGTTSADGFVKMQSPMPIQLSDYPALGTEMTKKQEKEIDYANKKTLVDTNQVFEHSDPRSASFAAMSDPTKIAASLTCTKACNLVTTPFLNPKDGASPRYGVCTRPKCTFAHSTDELQAPRCGFDGNCRFLHGKRDRKTRKIIPDTACKFRHSNETVEEWAKRANITPPALPPTNEHSRKPRVINTAKPSAQPSAQPAAKKFSSVPPPSKVSTVNHSRRTKSRWDEKPELPVDAKASPVYAKASPKSRRRRSYSYDSEYDSSDSSESDSSESDSSSSDSRSDEEERRQFRSRESSRRKHKSSRSKHKIPSAQVIRVPTKELAAIAIKAAFDRGQYNLQVIVED